MNFFGLQALSDGFASQEHPSVAKADLFFAPSFGTAEQAAEKPVIST